MSGLPHLPDSHTRKIRVSEFKHKNRIDASKIVAFEKCYLMMFPVEFFDFVLTYNGSHPDKAEFLNGTKKSNIKSVLSFEEKDEGNIWEYTFNHVVDDGYDYFPFAVDNFDNLICFDKDFKVYFYDHERGTHKEIAQNFTHFLNLLN